MGESPNLYGYFLGLLLTLLMVNAPEPFATIADIVMITLIIGVGAYLFVDYVEGE
jgi:hypothetical protein